jgi:hypothetical protein
MAINPELITTIRVDQLPDETLSLTNLFPHTVGTDLKSATIQELVDLVATAIGVSGGVGYIAISVTDGQQLPDVPELPSFFLCGAGTFLNINGYPDIICTENLNAVMSLTDHWELAVEIPINPLSGTVQSVTGSAVDNTDPLNPVINEIIYGVQNIIAGTNITVDNTDPANPIVSATGSGGSQTLQEVLDNNHDLVDGNNFQGTGAGVGNAGTGVIGFGVSAAFSNTGVFINALGEGTAYFNEGNNVNAIGQEAGQNNIYSHVNLFGKSTTADENGQTVLSKDGTIMARISTTDLTDTRKYNLPDADGTIALTSDIPSSSTFVPYTGATTNVDLGTHKLLAKDLDINHTSGSGDAATITKGGSGEALKVVKSSGSGNAASITGGVTLLDELHLTTDLADAYISSASTWNAKQNLVSLYNLTSQVTHTGTTAKTIILTYFIPANTFTNGDFLTFSALVTKVANINITTHTLEINTTNTLTGATIISTAGFNTTNFSMKFKREMALNGGNIYLLNINNATTNDQTIGTVPNGMSTFTYNLAADLYLFVTCQLNNATDSITYRGVSITKN